MAEEYEVMRLEKRPDFVPGRQERLTLRPRPNFVSGAVRNANVPGETMNLTKRNYHAIMFRKLHPDSMVREIEYPASCELCYRQNGIEEILENDQWWWYCPECGHKWDPIEAMD